MRPEEERELISYLERVIAGHPLRQGTESPTSDKMLEAVPAPMPDASPADAADAEAGVPADDLPETAPALGEPEAPEPRPPSPARDAPIPPTPDLGERGAGLRLLWGAPPPQTAPASAALPTEPPPTPSSGLPDTAGALYDRLERPPAAAVDQLQAVGISRATLARTGVRWTGDSGRFARHLAFPLRLAGVVRQLQFWPLEWTGEELTTLSLTGDTFGPPDGLFGAVPPPGEAGWVTETPLDALALNEHGFPAVASFHGLPPSAVTAAELSGRTAYLLSPDDETGEEWRRAWRRRLAENDVHAVDVLLPDEVDGRVIQGAHDLLRAMPLGFAFADALRRLAAEAEAEAVQPRSAIARHEPTAPMPEPELQPEPEPAPPAEPAPTPEPPAEPAPTPAPAAVASQDAGGEPAPTGIAELDARLAGGFGAELAVVAGPSGVGKTALLEDLALEAATRGRPVVFYCPREGSRSIRERLLSRLSHIMGGSPLDLRDIQSGSLEPEGEARLAELEQTFRLAVLPRLVLVDALPDGPEPVPAFLTELEHRLEERSRAHQSAPLLLVDDLQYLALALRVADAASLTRLLLGTRNILARAGAPGVVVSTSELRPDRSVGPGAPEPGGPELPPEYLADTLVVAGLSDPTADSEAEIVGLRFELWLNARTGWLGGVDLCLDRSSGLFWSGATA